MASARGRAQPGRVPSVVGVTQTLVERPTGATEPARPRRVFLWPLRVVVLPYAALLAAQPLLAGRFLEGAYEALKPHGAIGGGLIPLTWLVLGASVLVWRPGRFGAFPVVASGLLSVLIVAQVVAGYSRALGVHLPLGVAIVATGLAIAGWAWSPRRLRVGQRGAA